MQIRATCDDCGTVYDVPDGLAGRTVQCRQCGTVFAVPDVSILAIDPAFRIRGVMPANDPTTRTTEEESDAATDHLSELAAVGGGPNLARLDVRPKWRQAFEDAGGGVHGGWAAAARFGVTPTLAVVGLVAVVACLIGFAYPANPLLVGAFLVLAGFLYLVVGGLVASAMSAGQNVRDGNGRVMAGNVLVAGAGVTLAALTGVRVFGFVPLRRTQRSIAAKMAAKRRRAHVLRQTATLLVAGVGCVVWADWLYKHEAASPSPQQAFAGPPSSTYGDPKPSVVLQPADADGTADPSPARPPTAAPTATPTAKPVAPTVEAPGPATATTVGLRVLSRALADYAAANHGQYPPTLDAVRQTAEVAAARSATDVGYRPAAVAVGDHGLLLYDAAELAANGSAPAITVDGTATTAHRDALEDGAQ